MAGTPGFVRTNIVRWVKKGSEAAFLSQMRELRQLALNADGFIASEHLWSVEHKRKHLTTQTWSSLDSWTRFRTDPERLEMNRRLREHLTEDPVEDTYMPHSRERFEVDLDALHKMGH